MWMILCVIMMVTVIVIQSGIMFNTWPWSWITWHLVGNGGFTVHFLSFRCVHLWKISHIFAICKNGRSKFSLPIFEMTAAQPVIIVVLSVCSSEKQARYYLFVLNINKTLFWIQYNTEGMWYWKLGLVLFWGESKTGPE